MAAISAAAQRLSPGAGAVARVDAGPVFPTAATAEAVDRADCMGGGCGPGWPRAGSAFRLPCIWAGFR